MRETNNHAASVRVSGTDKREEDREKQMGHKGLAEGPGLRLQVWVKQTLAALT